ncbi:MAG: tripartite tricarboxylate transporter substrate binding protein [Xanthobacteraceae bacterium]|nr:tripartite tricarboxylate transporter substrate binding protein [Xanthobacteraceae bacterium]
MFRWLLAITLALLSVSSALAQGYPDRPVRLIVPFPAGGGVDTMARILANKLTDVLKQPVLVEHKPGAGGNVGSDFVAKSPPDGYTMLLNVNGIAISPSLYRKLSFDPLTDLIGVTQVAATQFLLTGSPKLEAKTVQEVIALARAKPGTLNYGSSGVGAPLHLQAEIFKHAAGGLQIMHIPYRGDAPMLTALLSGDVHIAFMPQSTGPHQVSSGQLRGLGVTGRKRWPSIPDVPTMLESGLNGMDDGSWYGLFVPAGTSPQIVQTLQQAMTKTLADPDVSGRIRSTGQEPVGSPTAEFQAFFKSEVARFARVIEAAQIPKLD